MLRSSFFWASAILTLLRKRNKFVLQTAKTDCGVASALAVLNLMSRPSDAVHAVDHMDPDCSGTSLEDLRLYFENQHGIAARALAVPTDRIREIKGRVILHMRQQHYIVLLKISKTGFLCFDPAMGPVFYPKADFASLYSGHLLEVGRPHKGATLPSTVVATPVVGGPRRRSIEPVALFVLGIASRLMECALLLCLVALLFLVLNHASFPALLTAFGLVAVCGGLLLLARHTRFDGEDKVVRKKQARVWRGLLRTAMKGRDLNGFRGRFEKDVASTVRRGLVVSVPQRAQLPATLGAFLTMPAILCVLSPIAAVAYLMIFGVALVILQLDTVHICRRSVRGSSGRYTKLSQGHDLLNAASGPELLGEVAKWSIIGFAGFSVMLAALPPVALMFWILAAMQLVPTDFRKAQMLAPAFGARDPVSSLIGTEVHLRRQRVMGPVELDVSHDKGIMRIDGIQPLTLTLQQPDLTVREQRLIMADVVRHTIQNLPDEDRPELGAIRIFAPGQDASQADIEYLMIAREAQPASNLPVKRDARKAIESSLQDPVLRALHSCEPGDFPVFWDFRSRLQVTDLRDRIKSLGIPRAAHLTLDRLTLVEAA